MKRLILWALNPPILILLAILGLAMQTSLFSRYPLYYLQPDLFLLLVIWCALQREFTEGGVMTLILGEISELHSASPQGFFLITYMATYLLVRAASKVVILSRRSSLLTMTFFITFFWKLLGLVILKLLGVGGAAVRHFFYFLIPSLAVQGFCAYWVYRWLERFDWVTFKNKRAQQALEEEMLSHTEDF